MGFLIWHLAVHIQSHVHVMQGCAFRFPSGDFLHKVQSPKPTSGTGGRAINPCFNDRTVLVTENSVSPLIPEDLEIWTQAHSRHPTQSPKTSFCSGSSASCFWHLEISLSSFRAHLWAHLWMSCFSLWSIRRMFSVISLAILIWSSKDFCSFRRIDSWATLSPQPLTGCPSSLPPLYLSPTRVIKCLRTGQKDHHVSTVAKA